jgi:UDPglucose 6-dehydrogenase
MIGIIGYGYVGKAVKYGFSTTEHIICDPAVNSVTISNVVAANPEAIFVCVPTPTDNTNYDNIKSVLTQITELQYSGIVVVKSTILFNHLDGFDVVVNPEFLSRGSSNQDFVNPPFVLFGGDISITKKLQDIYLKYSTVCLDKTIHTDVATASLAKYCFNSFYATKITFLNQIYDVCKAAGVSYDGLKDILKLNPWMGSYHFDVPGHEGRGFRGPCLPKDVEALHREYNLELLSTVLKINDRYIDNDPISSFTPEHGDDLSGCGHDHI